MALASWSLFCSDISTVWRRVITSPDTQKNIERQHSGTDSKQDSMRCSLACVTMDLSASNLESDEERWGHTFEEQNIRREGTAEIIRAHLQHSRNWAEKMKLVQWQKQTSIKIAQYQRCDDVSTESIQETALCPDNDASSTWRWAPRRLIDASSISEAGRN